MPLELLAPKKGPKGITGLAISVTKYNVTLSKELANDWPDNCNNLQIFLDKDKKIIALKPRKTSDSTTITLSKDKKSNRRFFQSRILLQNGVKTGKITMKFDNKNGMYIGVFTEGSTINGTLK
jgi:hypothetical protein